MIGPGTGVAPFRGFVQQRAETGARPQLAVLRQSAFAQRFPLPDRVAGGAEGRRTAALDLAFSRDQPDKVYVQHRLREQAASSTTGWRRRAPLRLRRRQPRWQGRARRAARIVARATAAMPRRRRLPDRAAAGRPLRPRRLLMTGDPPHRIPSKTSSAEDIKRRACAARCWKPRRPVTGALRDADQTLIKYHGSYQQDDRDIREERRRQKLEPAYSFMIRTRTPGGVVTPAQWLKLDAIATTFAERGLRITTRQAFQFHGVIKRELKATMQAINAALIDTLAACGDVNRNVAVAANPLLSRAHARTVYAQAAALSEHLLPTPAPTTRSGWTRSASPAAARRPSRSTADLPAAQVQDRLRHAADNDVDVSRAGPGLHRHRRRGRRARRLQRHRRRRHGRHPWRRRDLSAPGRRARLHHATSSCPRSPRPWSPPSATSATARCASARGSSTPSTTTAWTPSAPRSSAARRHAAPPRAFEFAHNGDRFGWVEGEDGRWHLTLRIPPAASRTAPRPPHLTGLREDRQALHRGRVPPDRRTRTW
jgi:hypothetical protein